MKVFKGITGLQRDPKDRIEICSEGCGERCLLEADIHVVGSIPPYTLSGNTIKSPKDIPSGQFYEVCYIKTLIGGNSISLPLGQVYF